MSGSSSIGSRQTYANMHTQLAHLCHCRRLPARCTLARQLLRHLEVGVFAASASLCHSARSGAGSQIACSFRSQVCGSSVGMSGCRREAGDAFTHQGAGDTAAGGRCIRAPGGSRGVHSCAGSEATGRQAGGAFVRRSHAAEGAFVRRIAARTVHSPPCRRRLGGRREVTGSSFAIGSGSCFSSTIHYTLYTYTYYTLPTLYTLHSTLYALHSTQVYTLYTVNGSGLNGLTAERLKA